MKKLYFTKTDINKICKKMCNNAIFSLNIFILANMDVLIKYVFFMLTSNEFIIAIS